MRFFTPEWWGMTQCGDIDKNQFELYRLHLDMIRDQLPSDLLALQETLSLHDGRLRRLELLPSALSLVIVVDGDDGSGGYRQYVLRYAGVSSFVSTANPAVGLPGPHGYGDWGYDEADVTPAGQLEHRILFSSGIEVVVQFKGFELG